MCYSADKAHLLRLEIYKSLIAHTRPLWSGVAAGQGAVIEHIEYRSGEIAFRALLGAQASQHFEDIDSALAWLAARDPQLRTKAIVQSARVRLHNQTVTACATGLYFVHPTEDRAIETCFVPMVLTRNRLRLERETLLWHEGLGTRPKDTLQHAPDKGVEFSPRDLPHVLSRFQRASLKMSWSSALEGTYSVAAKLILFQRYARHDPDALFEFLYEHTAI